jgi:4-hydroxybenzoate polyprenyltransferase
MRDLILTLRMIKWEHTIFALPFALIGLLVASEGRPGWVTLGWILLAMVGARSTAMAFNRLVDHRIDAANPRTAMRELPSGALQRGPVIAFVLASAALLVFAAWRLNPLCFALSPVALLVVWFYSLTKRFTPAAHLFLGLALGIAPVGAWLAVQGSIALFPILIGIGVMCWVAGFDILYSCQDLEFDRQSGLHSVPAACGPSAARWISRGLHVITLLAWGVAFRVAGFGFVATGGVIAVAALLGYEHWLVRSGDLHQIDKAFFELNSYVGIVLLATVLADLYWL